MTGRIGMDPDVVSQCAIQLSGNAHALDGVVAAVDGLVGDIANNWHGTDAQEFHAQWVGSHRSALTSLVATLQAFAATAGRNASAQSTASEAVPVAAFGLPANDWLGSDLNGLSNASLLLTGLLAGGAADAHAAALLLPSLEKLGGGLDALGTGLGVLGMGISAVSLGHDVVTTGGTSTATMNDELSLELGAVALALAPTGVGGAVFGAAALGVGVLQAVDPKLTADVFRLANPGAELVGAISDNFRKGDYNPIDIGSQVVQQEAAAAADLGHQAYEGATYVGSAVLQGAGDVASAGVHAVKDIAGGISRGVNGLFNAL